MHHNDLIVAHLAFRDCARGRLDEQDFYETYGKAAVVRPALNYALAAVRAAFRRLGSEARHLHGGARARTARSA